MFKQYTRIGSAEARPVTSEEIALLASELRETGISVSDEDELGGSPKVGDMIAHNPKNHDDVWLIAAKYFNDNFKEVV